MTVATGQCPVPYTMSLSRVIPRCCRVNTHVTVVAVSQNRTAGRLPTFEHSTQNITEGDLTQFLYLHHNDGAVHSFIKSFPTSLSMLAHHKFTHHT